MIFAEEFMPAISQAVSNALKQLLSEKHLYQYVEIDLDAVLKTAKFLHKELSLAASESVNTPYQSPPSLKSVIAEWRSTAENLWAPHDVPSPVIIRDTVPLGFDLPTINTFCNTCNDRWPFNPVPDASHLMQGLGQDEIFYLEYRCQQCKGRPISFLVCREALKLRLAGRSPLEVLPTPKVLPKSVSKYYGNAIVAHHAGQTLAGLFLLRVFIEQFWRTVPEIQSLIKMKPRASGDEQGEVYQSRLPIDFKSRFPSLTDVYGKLSEAIHSADENAALFDDSCVKIEEHFDARRLFRIVEQRK
jgi:hypothetical protein